MTQKRGVARAEDCQTVGLSIREHAFRRDPPNPGLRSPEGLRGGGVVDADGVIGLDDSAASEGGLPFEGIASQPFVRRALPHVAPEIRVAVLSLSLLNLRRHGFQFVPGWRRLIVAVLLQKVGSVVEHTDVHIKGNGHEPAVDGVVRQQRGQVGARNAVVVRAQIQKVGGERAGPNDVEDKNIGRVRAAAQQVGGLAQLLCGTAPSRNKIDANTGRGSEVAQRIAA